MGKSDLVCETLIGEVERTEGERIQERAIVFRRRTAEGRKEVVMFFEAFGLSSHLGEGTIKGSLTFSKDTAISLAHYLLEAAER